MREVPKKNYIILLIMAVAVVIIVFVLMNMYNANKPENYDSKIKEIINVIKVEDLESYSQENLDFVLYINDSTKTDQKLEKKIRNLITDNNIQQYFVYLETNDEIVKKYKLDDKTPIFISYKDGKISEIFYAEGYSITEIEAFLIKSGVIEVD